MEPPRSPPHTPVAKPARDKSLTVTAAVEDVSHNSIAGLLRIPYEIFTQIASGLGPGSLLALARTCKSLRAFLMSKSRIAMWQAAEQSTPRLPPRPTNMSQPQYAALAFMNECSFCGECTNVKLEPKLRVQLCESCRASELVDISTVKGYERLYLIRHLSLTLRGPVISSKDTEGGASPKSSSSNPRCLRRDLQNFYDTRERFLRAGDQDGLKRWEQKLNGLVGIHDQFAEMLRRFLAYPELTPMQKAWKREGKRFDRAPDRDESVFFNNYDTDVEDEDSDEDDEDSEEADIDRRHLIHSELQNVKPLTHPFRAVLEALGVQSNLLFAVLGLGLSNTHPPAGIEDYPFPTTATVLSWPCFSDFHELKPSQIPSHFLDELEHIIDHINGWREDGEEKLVEWWSSGTEPAGDLTNPIVKVRGSTAAAASLPSNLRLLLRADTIFSYRAPRAPGGQGVHLHYPHFYQNPNDCPCHGFPREMNSTRMYRHLEAERVTKVLLRGLGTPDIAYIQLLSMGATLVCGRCSDSQPKTWDQIIDHYCEAAQLWAGLQSRAPEFKTKRPLKFTNVHNLKPFPSPKPFVRRLTKQEATSLANPPALGVDQGFYCILCRNYKICHIFKTPALLFTHMNDVHGVANPIAGLHFTSRASGAKFSGWGKKWRDTWDAHQAAREWDS